MEAELEEEMAFHLEQETQKQIERGADPATARVQAEQRFGRTSHHKDAARKAWGVGLLDDLVVDVRYALRQLVSQKTFSVVAILTLGCGIGGTIAMLSALDGLLLRPLPYEDAQQLQVFWDEYSWSAEEFDFARGQLDSWQGVAAFTTDAQVWRVGERTSMVRTALVSGDALSVLGGPRGAWRDLWARGGACGSWDRGCSEFAGLLRRCTCRGRLDGGVSDRTGR